MKRIVLLMLLPLLLAVGCTHRTGRPSEGALYRQYASRPELQVAEVVGFRLNDTVRVDVVMMQAESEEAWQQMKEEFDIRGEEGTVSWLGEADHPALRTQWNGEAVMRVVASHPKQTIGFYRIETEAQYDALLDYQINKLMNGE